MHFLAFLAVLCLAVSPASADASLPGAALFLQGDAAERAGRTGDALKAYTACAAADERLMPFAANRAARVRARSGDAEGAETWPRMAKDAVARRLAARIAEAINETTG